MVSFEEKVEVAERPTEDLDDERPMTATVSKDHPWREEHADWKEVACHSEIVHHDVVPDGRKAEIKLIKEVFRKVDSDHNHELDVDEFGKILMILDPHVWTEEQIKLLFDAADENGNGSLDMKELVHFVLGSHHENDSESDPDDYEDNWTDSEEDEGPESPGGSQPRIKTRKSTAKSLKGLSEEEKAEKRRRRFKKREDVLTTCEEMYELLTMHDGRIEGRLALEDFVAFWADCGFSKVAMQFASNVPQQIHAGDPGGAFLAEDVSSLQMAHLCKLLKDNPEATLQDAETVAQDVGSQGHNGDVEGSGVAAQNELKRLMKEQGVDGKIPVGFKAFRKLTEFAGSIMKLDECSVLSIFTWARTRRLEITEAMAIEVIRRVFLKVVPSDGRDAAVSENDVSRMCRGVDIIDPHEKHGIPSGKIPIIFGTIQKQLSQLRVDREDRRLKDRGGRKKDAKIPQPRKHLHCVGRSELSVLFEELFKLIPGSAKTYGSPLAMLLTFIERSDLHAQNLTKKTTMAFAKPSQASSTQMEKEGFKKLVKKQMTWSASDVVKKGQDAES